VLDDFVVVADDRSANFDRLEAAKVEQRTRRRAYRRSKKRVKRSNSELKL